MLERARALFGEMQREYASGNFARYGELLQQLGKLLQPMKFHYWRPYPEVLCVYDRPV